MSIKEKKVKKKTTKKKHKKKKLEYWRPVYAKGKLIRYKAVKLIKKK